MNRAKGLYLNIHRETKRAMNKLEAGQILEVYTTKSFCHLLHEGSFF